MNIIRNSPISNNQNADSVLIRCDVIRFGGGGGVGRMLEGGEIS